MTERETGSTVTFEGPGPLFLVRADAADGDTAGTLLAGTDCAILHGWLDAQTVTRLLERLGPAHTFRAVAAVQNAARTIDLTAPGTAALCGLARCLVSTTPRPQRIAAAISQRYQGLSARERSRLDHDATMRLTAATALAGPTGDDPAALAALFLRPHRLRAGEALPLRAGVPVALVAGRLSVSTAPGAHVVVGAAAGAGRADVAGFTTALATEPATWWSRSA